MPADPTFEGRRGRTADPLPWWYRLVLVVVLAVVMALAVAGTTLAMLGWFYAVPLVLLSAPVAYALVRAWRPMLLRPDARRGAGVAGVALVVVVAFVGLQMRESAQHVIVDRDPGVYVVTGLSLARTGDLLVDPGADAFGSPPPQHVRFDTPGFYRGAPNGRLYPQFLHVLPVLIAVGEGIGGPTGAMQVPAVLEGLALLAVYAFATRFLRPTLALGVLVLAALNLTTIAFSRDAYTEPLTQLLLFAALWTIWPTRRPVPPGLGTAAGFLLGVCVMTRIDAVVYLIPLIAWGFIELRRDFRSRRWLGPAAVSAAVPSLLAVIDAAYFARPYTTDLAGSLLPLLAALVIVVGVGVALVWRAEWFDRTYVWFDSHRRRIAATTAIAVTTLAFAAWLVRPLVSTSRAGRAPSYAKNLEALQAAEHVAIDGTRTYAEYSVRWLSWYLSPTVLILGFAAMGYLVWRVVRGERRELAPFLALFIAVTALYAWRPSIDPNQVWAMRRFFPVTIPGLLLLAALGAELLGQWMNRFLFTDLDRRRLTAILAICIVGPALIVPLRDLKPVLFESEFASLVPRVEEVCHAVPTDAVVYIPTSGLFADRLAPPLRAMCGARVAVSDFTNGEVGVARQLHDVAAADGRPFFVVSDVPDPFGDGNDVPSPELVTSARYLRLELTVESVPDGFWNERLDLWVARWP